MLIKRVDIDTKWRPDQPYNGLPQLSPATTRAPTFQNLLPQAVFQKAQVVQGARL